MPRLIAGGPDIPAELIQKQEAREMVFFCGAGISLPTGLPDFRGLVDQLYSSLHLSPEPSEQEAIERGEFDKTLKLLEKRLTPNTVRVEVARRLSCSPKPGSLRLHRALLDVSRNASGARLVTTNYDDNFARADSAKELRFQAGPDLPGLGNWNSVVHLHGRLEASAAEHDVSTLVLTSSDFGKAYVYPPAWAAEFVASLMERYTVVFVGYRLGDVVVRYLTEAVSESPTAHTIYSLVGFADDEQREKRESKWKEHGIQPILYDSRNEHELLVRTVEEWAKLSADPHEYRVRIAVSGLRRTPDRELHEACPDRMIWALSDPAAAWPAFNQIRQTPVPGRYAAAWLQEFAVGGLLGGTIPPRRHERGPAGPVVTGRAEQQMLQTDSVADSVAFWIEIHAHAPEVFKWVISHGRSLHVELRRRLWDRLVSPERDAPDIPPPLARLWVLLLAEPPEDYQFLMRLDRILNSLAQQIPEATDDVLLRLLRPRLGVLPGPSPYRSTRLTEDSKPEEVALLECGHTDVVLGCRDEQPRFNVVAEIQPSRFSDFLGRHSITLTEYLKTAFVLLGRSDQPDARFLHFQISDALASDDSDTMIIAGTADIPKRRRDRRRKSLHSLVGTWTVLLDWVRESYDVFPQGDKRRDVLLRSWVASDEPTLGRLALAAIEHDRAADFDLAGTLLLRGIQQPLWDPNCTEEVLAVLQSAGTRASPELQARLVDAVQSKGDSGADPQNADGAILAPVGYRLAALATGGATLPPAATRILATFEERRRVATPGSRETGSVVLSGRIREVIEALRTGPVDVGVFAGFARQRPAAALLALEALGRSGDWPGDLWKKALDVVETRVRDTGPGSRHSVRLAELLLRVPDGPFHELQHETSRLVEALAESWPGNDDRVYWRLWARGWEHRAQQSGTLGRIDTLTHAMNTTAGRYAGAAMKRIQLTERACGSIADEQLHILDRIACDGSGLAGIVMLMFSLEWLHGHVPEWTARRIFPRLRWESGSHSPTKHQEVRALWGVVAFRGWVPRGVVEALDSDLWTAVQRHKEVDRGENLVRFFVHASIGDPKLIDEPTCRETARLAVRDSPWQVGVALREVLDKSGRSKEQSWRELVRPWLDNYWPREKSLNTGESSSALVDIITGTGDAFPDAVDWANGYLMALNDRQIGSVWYHKTTWESHPRVAVALLHRIVPEEGIDPWARSSLAEMLKGIRKKDAAIAQDANFVELERRAAR